MSKKILIVDDSALMRRVESDIINSENEYEVAGCARDGLDALNMITGSPEAYDAIILDINMPRMSGIELLEELQKRKIRHCTIVVSTVAVEGAKETIRALELGAFDFVTKPVNYAEVSGVGFREKLIQTLDLAMNSSIYSKDVSKAAMSGRTSDISMQTGSEMKRNDSGGNVGFASKNAPKKTVADKEPEVSVKTATTSAGRNGMKKLVALACSTGGPKSLQSVIPKLPANMDAPMVLVQHMPKGFTFTLAQRLNELSAVTVTEAVDGDVLEKGHVYIAPGGRHMLVTKTTAGSYQIRLRDDPPVDALRPCANVMYDSLINTDYDEITCVVLTGMGSDGTRGITHLSSMRKVYVIAQDEASSVVYGMPKAIADSGLVNEVVPLEEIAAAIIKNVGVS
ncbi:MAG: chemotaxis-specific protein-glutamate methyltransferase CheB [Lachnospiraceae bacterium]